MYFSRQALSLSKGGYYIPSNVVATLGSMPSSQAWFYADSGNGIIVAINIDSTGANNIYATSVNGVTWTQRTFPTSAVWGCIKFINGKFYVFPGNLYGYNYGYSSTDGITWTTISLTATAAFTSLTYGNGIIFLTSRVSNTGFRSTDGITWVKGSRGSFDSFGSTYGNGLFVEVPYTETTTATSPDGISWTNRTAAIPSSARSVCYAPYNGSNITSSTGVFIATSLGSGGSTYYYSVDGISWTSKTFGSFSSTNWRNVSYHTVSDSLGYFLALSADGVIIFSSDGITWTRITLPSGFTMHPNGSVLFKDRILVMGGYAGSTQQFLTIPFSMI